MTYPLSPVLTGLAQYPFARLDAWRAEDATLRAIAGLAYLQQLTTDAV